MIRSTQNLGIPAVFIGAATSVLPRNTVCNMSPTAVPPTGATPPYNDPLGNVNTQVRFCLGDEIDLWNFDSVTTGTYPGRETLQGMTITYPIFNTSIFPSQYSYSMYLAGGGPVAGMPQVLKLDGAYAYGCLICGDTFYVSGGGPPANTVGAKAMNFGSWIDVDGAANWLLQGYIQKFATGTDGISDASYVLGVTIDGNVSTPASGTPQAKIVWSRPGYQGGLSLVPYNCSTDCGIDLAAGGDITLHGGSTGVVVGNSSKETALIINGVAGYFHPLGFQDAGVNRWVIGEDESQNFSFSSYNSNGTLTGTSVTIDNSNGDMFVYGTGTSLYSQGNIEIGTTLRQRRSSLTDKQEPKNRYCSMTQASSDMPFNRTMTHPLD